MCLARNIGERPLKDGMSHKALVWSKDVSEVPVIGNYRKYRR